MEFNHYVEMTPNKRGVKGSDKYAVVGHEVGIGRDKVKENVMMINTFHGDGEIVIDRVFGKELSYKSACKIGKALKKFPEKFNSETSFDRISQPDFDYDRLIRAIEHLSIDNDEEYQIIQSYLRKEFNHSEFEGLLKKLGKLKNTQEKHKGNKVFTPVLDDTFTTLNSHIIKGDNRTVSFIHPFGKKVRCFVVSPPYGDKRKNSDGESETGHGMSGEKYGRYLAQTFEMYIQHMEEDGSLYVIIDDYLYEGEYACSLEYFVVEMRKLGFHLISRYKWVKNNPLPKPNPKENSRKIKITNGFEMAYRFVLDKENYYTNPHLFIETDDDVKVLKGCTNHSGNGTTTRGGLYVQGNLKKTVNVLDCNVVDDVIKSNVANPDDWFRQADEKYHSSQFPPEIAAFFILEGSQEGDLCGDIYNGVGNSLTASLLLNRKFIGVECENSFFQQTCRKASHYDELMIQGEGEITWITSQTFAA